MQHDIKEWPCDLVLCSEGTEAASGPHVVSTNLGTFSFVFLLLLVEGQSQAKTSQPGLNVRPRRLTPSAADRL